MKETVPLTRGQRDRQLMLSMIDNSMRLDYSWQRAYAHFSSANTYYSEIYDTMDPTLWDSHFILAARKYLAEYRDSNLALLVSEEHAEAAALPDFEAHRYGDRLYVTRTLPGSLLHIGDVITHLGQRSVMQARELARFYLPKSDTDSYRENWTLAIASVPEITVLRDDVTIFVPVIPRAHADIMLAEAESSEKEESAEVQVFSGKALLMNLKNLSDKESAEALLRNYLPEAAETQFWILDLRGNKSIDDTAFIPFLSILADEPLMIPAARYYTHYTEQNCRRRVSWLEETKQRNPKMAPFLDGWIQETQKKSGSGFQKETDEELPEMITPDTAEYRRCVILADHTTSAAAERFVRVCSKLTRCLIAGRETAGSCDTFGPVSYPLGDGYALVYPISITKEAHEEETTFAGKGVQPDLPIPWTPGDQGTDRDLEALLQRLEEELPCKEKA